MVLRVFRKLGDVCQVFVLDLIRFIPMEFLLHFSSFSYILLVFGEAQPEGHQKNLLSAELGLICGRQKSFQ